MKKALNLSAIVLIFAFVYMPLLGVDPVATSSASSINFFNRTTPIKKESKTIKMPTVSAIPDSSLNIKKSVKTSNYANGIVDVWSKTSFKAEDFNQMKKDKNGRPFSVEELAKQAEVMGVSSIEKRSFEAWSDLDQQVVEELKKVPINSSLSSTQKDLISWYKYHSDFAKKMADQSLSKEEIKKLNNDYSVKTKHYLPILQKKIAAVLDGEIDKFALQDYFINTAKAIGGAPAFGGLVVSYNEICLTGFSFTVFGVQGGWMWIYYATMAIVTPATGARANYVIYPSVHIKGKSVPVPGVCTRILVDAHPSGMATVILYGSSLIY